MKRIAALLPLEAGLFAGGKGAEAVWPDLSGPLWFGVSGVMILLGLQVMAWPHPWRGQSWIDRLSWLPAVKARADMAEGERVAADFDRMFQAAMRMSVFEDRATEEEHLEAMETWEELWPKHGPFVGGEYADDPKGLLTRLLWLAATFRRYGYRAGARRAKG